MDNIKNPIYLGLCLGIDILVEIGSTKGGTLCRTFSKFVRHFENGQHEHLKLKKKEQFCAYLHLLNAKKIALTASLRSQ